MKICYINPTFLIRRPLAELVRLLSKNNDIAIFLPKKPFSKIQAKWHSDESLKKAKIYSYSAINIPFINFEWPIPITPMFFINLYKVFRKYNIIHMWTYFYINSLFTLIYKLFAKKTKLIMTSDTFPGHSFNPGFPTNILFKIYTLFFGWFLFSVPDKVHLYGKSMIKYAKKAGVKEEKITVIPTGINFEKFSKAQPADRKELGIKKNGFVILYAGLIVPRKGIDIMLKVVKRLSKKQKNIKLLLVGEGPEKEKYQEIAKSYGIKDNVLFKSWRKDIPNIMKSADILLLPSRGEGLPGIVMEAMASGLPVVASNIPCIPDLIDDKKTGFLCKQDDLNEFSKAVKKLAKSKNLRLNMGKTGQQKISKFKWSKLLNNYKSMYK